MVRVVALAESAAGGGVVRFRGEPSTRLINVTQQPLLRFQRFIPTRERSEREGIRISSQPDLLGDWLH